MKRKWLELMSLGVELEFEMVSRDAIGLNIGCWGKRRPEDESESFELLSFLSVTSRSDFVAVAWPDGLWVFLWAVRGG